MCVTCESSCVCKYVCACMCNIFACVLRVRVRVCASTCVHVCAIYLHVCMCTCRASVHSQGRRSPALQLQLSNSLAQVSMYTIGRSLYTSTLHICTSMRVIVYTLHNNMDNRYK